MFWISLIWMSAYAATIEQACIIIADKCHLKNQNLMDRILAKNPNLDKVELRWRMSEDVYYKCIDILTEEEAFPIRYMGMIDLNQFQHITRPYKAEYKTADDLKLSAEFEETRTRLYAEMEKELDEEEEKLRPGSISGKSFDKPSPSSSHSPFKASKPLKQEI